MTGNNSDKGWGGGGLGILYFQLYSFFFFHRAAGPAVNYLPGVILQNKTLKISFGSLFPLNPCFAAAVTLRMCAHTRMH